MKIMLVILRAESKRGGAERYTRDLAAMLLAGGTDVLTVAASFDPDWPGRTREIKTPALTRAGEYARFLDGVDAAINAEPDRIVHAMLPVRRAHLYHPHAGIAAAPKRNPLLEPFNRRRNMMSRVEHDLLTSPNPTLTLALSNYVLGHLRRFYPDAPADVLLNGVNLDLFDPAQVSPTSVLATRNAWGTKESDYVVLCVAQDFRRKGVHLAIEALLHDERRVDKLVVVGRDDPTPMVALAKKLGVQDRVLFPGPRGDLCPAYAAASAFVLPTSHDPCPLVTIEALAMGLPVISTRFNGACEYMTDGVHGRIVDLNPASIALGLREFSDLAARKCAKEQIANLRPRLDVRAHVDHLGETYQRLQKRLSD